MNIRALVTTAVLMLSAVSAHAADFRNQKLALQGSGIDCGLDFSADGKSVDLFLPTGEMCAPLMTLRSKWLDANTLLLVELNSHDDITPPRTFLYKVKSVQGQRVVLTEIWTGWGEVANQDQVYLLEAH